MEKRKIILAIKKTIERGESKGMSGDAISMLLNGVRNKLNLSKEEFKVYEDEALNKINNINEGAFGEIDANKKEQSGENEVEENNNKTPIKKREYQPKPGNPGDQGYTIEENDDPRTWKNYKESVEYFLRSLNTILESSSDRNSYLNYLNSYKILNESILDPIHKERCPEVFKGDKMLPSVRSYILSILNDFKRQVNFPMEINNVYMIGSSTGYQYTITSDVDIEVETEEEFEKLFVIEEKEDENDD